MNFVSKILIIITSILLQCDYVNAKFKQEPLTQNRVKSFQAFNGLQIDYCILFPLNYDVEKAYPAILSFSTYQYNETKTMNMINSFWNESVLQDYLVIIPFSPQNQSRGWVSHPAHHALLDFLKMINKMHKIEQGKFHLMGFEEGCIPAQTYLTNELFVSLTTVSSDEWRLFDSDWYNKMAKHNVPTLLIYGGADEKGIQSGKTANTSLRRRGVNVELIVEPGDRKTLPSANNGQVLKHLTTFLSE